MYILVCEGTQLSNNYVISFFTVIAYKFKIFKK